MDQKTAFSILHTWDRQGKYIYSFADFMMIFGKQSRKTLQESLNRFVKAGFLERLCRGLYLFSFTAHKNRYLIEKIAIALRPGHYNYLSLESALSEYGVISQIPIDRITVMTTGRKGECETPYGVVEFTHTRRTIFDILENTLSIDRPLRFAKKQTAWRDLKRVGRNLHLVDLLELKNE